MSSENDLIQANVQAKETAGFLKEMGDQARSAKDQFEEMSSTAASAFSTIFQIVSNGMDAVTAYNESVRGLRLTAEEMGLDFDELKDKADELAQDGLMSVADTAASMQNLLQSGFNLDETVTVIDRLKDSAAFGRNEALSFGEAVKSATEGIVSGNSILVNSCPLAV